MKYLWWLLPLTLVCAVFYIITSIEIKGFDWWTVSFLLIISIVLGWSIFYVADKTFEDA